MKDYMEKLAEVSEAINELDEAHRELERNNLWGHILRQGWKVDDCPSCGWPMRVISFMDDARGYNQRCYEYTCLNEECAISWEE